jgi:hypothetical protein
MKDSQDRATEVFSAASKFGSFQTFKEPLPDFAQTVALDPIRDQFSDQRRPCALSFTELAMDAA